MANLNLVSKVPVGVLPLLPVHLSDYVPIDSPASPLFPREPTTPFDFGVLEELERPIRPVVSTL